MNNFVRHVATRDGLAMNAQADKRCESADPNAGSMREKREDQHAGHAASIQ
jgi:hypothetical protein